MTDLRPETSPPIEAVLFDFSGTLFRLEEDDSWFAGMELDSSLSPAQSREVDGHVQAELMRRRKQA